MSSVGNRLSLHTLPKDFRENRGHGEQHRGQRIKLITCPAFGLQCRETASSVGAKIPGLLTALPGDLRLELRRLTRG